MPREKPLRKTSKASKRHTPMERAAILATAKAERLTGDQVAANYGIARITYYLWRRQAGARGWYGVGRRVAWTPTAGKAGERLPSALKRTVREVVAQLVRQEIDSRLGGLRFRRTAPGRAKLRKGQ
jgi:transposase-like protein